MRAEHRSLVRPLYRLVQIALFYLMLLWLGTMLLLGNVACLPLVFAPRAWREALLQDLISRTFRLFLDGCSACGLMRLDLGAIDALNDRSQMLLVANHPSMIDVFLVISRVRRAVCLMKAGIGSNVFLAVGARLAGYISNRSTSQMIRDATEAVSQGRLLLAFPEGTRTTVQPMNRLKPGVALVAKRARAPLQLILIETNSPYLSQGWKIWRPPQFPLVYKLSLGERVLPAATVAETVARLQHAFHARLHCSIAPGLTLD